MKSTKFNINKKVIAIVLILFTILGNISPIFAASGSGTWVGQQYDSLIKTTEYEGKSYGIYLRKLTDKATGVAKTVFCSEHGVEFYSRIENDGTYYTPTDLRMKSACKVAYFGWYSKYGDYVVSDEILTYKMKNRMMDYVYTQQYIWETLGESNATFLDADVQAGYIEFKNTVDAQINAIQVKPSFVGTTIELDAGETKEIHDNNGVLASYPSLDKTVDGIRIVHNIGENILKITIAEDCNVSQYRISDSTFSSWGMVKDSTQDNDTTIYFAFEDGIQNQLYSLHYNDPVTLSLDLQINLFGNLEIEKVNKNNKLIDGVVFRVTNDDGFDKNVTTQNGKVLLENLKAGKYYIEEVTAPEGYLLDKTKYEVEVRGNKTEVKTIVNEQPTGTLIINKNVALRDEADTSLVDVSDLSKVKFRLSAKENVIDIADSGMIYEEGTEIGTYNLSKEGDLTISDLPMGTYELEEVETTDGLVSDSTKYEVKFTKKDNITKVYTETKEISNETTLVEFSKTDITGDKELDGATLTVTDEDGNEIDKWVSGEETHKIEGLKAGATYILTEEIAPDGYVKSSSIAFTVENTNEIQKVTMVDKVVDVTKTDMVNGEEVEGAELVVTDEEGNVIDKWISEKEPHHVIGLEEGKKYILTETTAPYGYEIAESIEFEVSYDKNTQHIEMEDMPILKNVKVEKIDKETGEHIKSNKFEFGIFEDAECTKLIKKAVANEDEGIALFDNLRYGTYYIKEVKAPLGYKLSDQVVKIEINDEGVFADGVSLEEKDSVYSFEYYNTLLPKIQTGNETNYILLLVIMGISLLGIITGVFLLKKKK